VLAGGTRAGHMLAIGDVMVFVMFLLSLLRGGANELGITNIAHIAHMLFRSSWVLYYSGGRAMERGEVA